MIVPKPLQLGGEGVEATSRAKFGYLEVWGDDTCRSEEVAPDEATAAPQAATAFLPEAVLDACSVAARNIGHSSLERLGVTSCRRGDGRSTIAAGLAVTYGYEYQRETILVELDTERPSLAATFDLVATPGIAEVVRKQAPLDDCVRRVGGGLSVLTAGEGLRPGDLFRHSTVARLLASLQDRCEVLIADLPPLTPGAGTLHLTDLCGSVAIVVRSGSAHRDEVAAAAASLKQPIYVVLNDVQQKTPKLVRRLLGLTND